MRARATTMAGGLAAALVMGACSLLTPLDLPAEQDADPRSAPTPAPSPAAPASVRPTASDEAAARRWLPRLAVEERTTYDPTYRREAFGSSWRDIDGNGCNQRDDVLLRDAVPGSTTVQEQGRCDHDVLAGTWHDPYTGRELVMTDLKQPRQAQAVQIDHVVPLAEAWRSGARDWDQERRARFAGDLAELLAVDGPANMGKGDDDPAAWRPRKAYQCSYAVRWVATKQRWRLAVDAAEVRALGEMLDYC